MLAELVIVTRFLGLVAGEQNVALEAGPDVHSIELSVDGRRDVTLTKSPWKGKVDLGVDLEPHELTAIAFDAAGVEVGRDTQLLNIARPRAELQIVLERDGGGAPHEIRLESTHFKNARPKRSVIRLDGRTIGRSTSVSLPATDPRDMHVVSAEVTFEDDVVVRKELVFGGVYSEQMPADLTAIGVRQREASKAPGPCLFTFGEHDLAPAAVERGPAIVSFILNGDANDRLRRNHSYLRDPLYAIPDAEFRLVTPIATAIQQRDYESAIFPSMPIDGSRGTRSVMLYRTWSGEADRRFADALAVAGVRSLGSNRRAVVYVIGELRAPDHSAHSPETVRRYLESVGVPLRVWSTSGPHPELEAAWGRIRDVSSAPGLLEATSELKHELEMQRVAWLPAGPLEALRARPNDDCGYVALARFE
jgi:hypothetical protein